MLDYEDRVEVKKEGLEFKQSLMIHRPDVYKDMYLDANDHEGEDEELDEEDFMSMIAEAQREGAFGE